MQIEFEAYGEQLVARKLIRWADRAVDASPAFEAIADQMAGMEEARFTAQGYGLWPPLAASTSLQKAQAGLDPRILHATLALRESLTEKDDEAHLRIVTDDGLIFGTTVEYAGFHQRGRGVPRRRPLQFSEAEKKTLVKTLQRYLATGAAA
jgi:phage gpG-like protein